MWNCKGTTVREFGRDRTGQISYTFNQQGFRSNREFDFVPDYAFFGCSIVVGIGVPIEKTFASQFENSQNYGVCGNYDNSHILDIILNFSNSACFRPQTKLFVLWTNRDSNNLLDFYRRLEHLNITHMFCGPRLDQDKCYSMITNVDWDVSGTHPGEKTHQILYKMICPALNR